MTQVCEPARRQIRRLSAEEFCVLAQKEACSLYRPRSEVLRMLAVGEVWGVPDAALIVLPLCADTAAAAALRSYVGRRKEIETGCFLTPPVLRQPERLDELLPVVSVRTERLARGGTLWAVLECGPEAEELLPFYLKQGFVLRALRPLQSLAPCFLLCNKFVAVQQELIQVRLEDKAHLARLLAQGYGAVDCRPTRYGMVLMMALAQRNEDEKNESCYIGKLCHGAG